jgi:threonine dehydrogenase-like Zn-dependent dehydrogenase/glycosyltransferase involved in cell wall biosynthesis
MTERPPETSVVIRAMNEERWLPEVLAKLDQQRYRDFEVLVVDSGSVDRTRDIAAAAGARIIRLRSEDFTFGHSLNVGIREARGRFMAIVSAHAIPLDENWLELLVAPLRDEKVAMVFGGQIGHAVSKFSEARDFERQFPEQGYVVDEEQPFANNANSAVTRAGWEEHPFDEGLPGLEDIEWAKYWMKKGRQVVYEPKACIIHVHTESWPQVRRRFYREAMAARWIRLKILRHIPREVWREVRWLADDFRQAASRGQLARTAREILRFRYEKTVGTIGGIVDSRGLDNPAKRSEIFFQRGFPAVVVRGPNNVRIEERGVRSLKPGEVLLRVGFVGICATDLEVLEGTLGYYKSGMAQYPIVPGHESSGTVVAVGPRVTEFNHGDKVVVECIQGCGECPACARDDAIQCKDRREVGVMGHDGAYATYLITRARYVHHVPEGVSLAQAALTEPLAVVHKALRRLGSQREGDRPRRCAVIGAGTIGQLTARVLALRGHKVTLFDRQAERLGLVGPIAETSTTLDDLSGFEWFVEATGQQAALSALLDKAPTGATMLLLGFPYGTQPFNFESLVGYDRTLLGSVGSTAKDFDDALATLAQIDTTPFLGASYALEDYEKAWSVVRSRSVLKVMLRADATA